LTWQSEKAKKLSALKDFSDQIAQKGRPLFDFLDTTHFPTSVQALEWCLLASALNQGISESRLNQLLVQLYQALGDRIFQLPAPDLKTLDSIISKELGLSHWTLRKKAPGIIWSVGAFIRDHSPFSNYLQIFGARQIISDVRRSVFFMGRHSLIPAKALWFIQNLTLPKPLGLSIQIEDGLKVPAPVSSGARRWATLIGPNQNPRNNESNNKNFEKFELEYFNKLYSKCEPDYPGKLAWTLQFFLEKREGTFSCRLLLGGCSLCALKKWCKYCV
jgi:hypothetical protein